MTITYSRKIRELAEKRGKDLFCCGVRQLRGKGLFEFVGPMSWEMGFALTLFANKIHTGSTPAEAFAQVKWPSGGGSEVAA